MITTASTLDRRTGPRGGTKLGLGTAHTAGTRKHGCFAYFASSLGLTLPETTGAHRLQVAARLRAVTESPGLKVLLVDPRAIKRRGDR